MKEIPEPYLAQCTRCGYALWWHEAGKSQWCPEHPGRMDWTKELSFCPSGNTLTQEEAQGQYDEE